MAKWIETHCYALHRFDGKPDANGFVTSECGLEVVKLASARVYDYPADGKGGPDCMCAGCINWDSR